MRNQCSNGKLEVPVHLLKAKQGYTVRKMEKDKWIYYYTNSGRKISSGVVYRPISGSVKQDTVRFQVLTAASIKISLLGCSAVYSRRSRPTFQRCVLPQSSGR
jgi:hypothetical protein